MTEPVGDLPMTPDVPDPGPVQPAAPADGTVEQLFREYADRLCRYVLRYVGSVETAQDLVQDLFLRLCDMRPELEQMRDVRGYLYSAARNRALTHLKQRRVEQRWRERQDGSAVGGDGSWHADPDQHLLSAEIAAAIQQAVDALPERQRQVLLLRWSGCSYEQIAARLDISPKTVSNHLTRAVERLRKVLPRFVR